MLNFSCALLCVQPHVHVSMYHTKFGWQATRYNAINEEGQLEIQEHELRNVRSKRYLIRAGRQSYLETMDEDIPKPHEDSKMPVAGVPSLFNSLLFDVCNGKWPFILPGQSQSQDDSDTSHSGASKFLFMGFVAISSLSVLYNCNRAVTLIFFFCWTGIHCMVIIQHDTFELQFTHSTYKTNSLLVPDTGGGRKLHCSSRCFTWQTTQIYLWVTCTSKKMRHDMKITQIA